MSDDILVNGLKEYISSQRLSHNKQQVSRKNLEANLDAIERVNLGIEQEAQTDLYVQRLKEIYPVINPSFLSLKHARKYEGEYTESGLFMQTFSLTLPRFAFYSLDSPICEFQVSVGYRHNRIYNDEPEQAGLHCISFRMLSPKMPSAFRKFWNSVAIRKCSYKSTIETEKGYEFTSVFKGIIPKEIRRKLKFYRRIFGHEVYVIAEAQNWDGKEIPTVSDPLLIGVKGRKCFLIESFETTPAEDYVRREFKE